MHICSSKGKMFRGIGIWHANILLDLVTDIEPLEFIYITPPLFITRSQVALLYRIYYQFLRIIEYSRKIRSQYFRRLLDTVMIIRVCQHGPAGKQRCCSCSGQAQVVGRGGTLLWGSPNVQNVILQVWKEENCCFGVSL